MSTDSTPEWDAFTTMVANERGGHIPDITEPDDVMEFMDWVAGPDFREVERFREGYDPKWADALDKLEMRKLLDARRDSYDLAADEVGALGGRVPSWDKVRREVTSR